MSLVLQTHFHLCKSVAPLHHPNSLKRFSEVLSYVCNTVRLVIFYIPSDLLVFFLSLFVMPVHWHLALTAYDRLSNVSSVSCFSPQLHEYLRNRFHKLLSRTLRTKRSLGSLYQNPGQLSKENQNELKEFQLDDNSNLSFF